MKKGGVSLVVGLLKVSLFFPAGLAALSIAVVVVLGALNFVLGGCQAVDGCLVQPLSDLFRTDKAWRLLLGAWAVSLFAVCAMTYEELKPWIHRKWFERNR